MVVSSLSQASSSVIASLRLFAPAPVYNNISIIYQFNKLSSRQTIITQIIGYHWDCEGIYEYSGTGSSFAAAFELVLVAATHLQVRRNIYNKMYILGKITYLDGDGERYILMQ